MPFLLLLPRGLSSSKRKSVIEVRNQFNCLKKKEKGQKKDSLNLGNLEEKSVQNEENKLLEKLSRWCFCPSNAFGFAICLSNFVQNNHNLSSSIFLACIIDTVFNRPFVFPKPLGNTSRRLVGSVICQHDIGKEGEKRR